MLGTCGHSRAGQRWRLHDAGRMITSMPASDIPSIITGAAVLAGALAAGGITWLFRLSDSKRAKADRRRGIYAAFIGAANELTRLLIGHQTMQDVPAPNSAFGENLAQAVGVIDRAYIAVVLDSSEAARRKAEGVRRRAWQIYNLVHGHGPPVQDILVELRKLAAEFRTARLEFTDRARKEMT